MAKYTATLMEIIQSELQNMGHDEFINKGHLTFNDSEFAFIQKVLRYDEDVQKIVNSVFFKGFKFNDELIDRYFKESFVTRFIDREIGRQTVEAFASQVLYVTLTREDYIYTVFGQEMQKYMEQHTETISEDRGKGLENTTEQGQTKQRTQDKTHEDYRDDTNEKYQDTTNEENSSRSDNRSAESTLPQSEVNLNVDNTVLDYADTNNISRDKSVGTKDTESKGTKDVHSEGDKDGTLDSRVNGESDSKRNSQNETQANHEGLTKTYLVDNLEKIKNMRDEIFNIYDQKCFLHIW